MWSFRALLLVLWSEDATLWLEGDKLHCEVRQKALTPELQVALREHKVKLIEILRQRPHGETRLWLPAKEYFSMFWAPRPE